MRICVVSDLYYPYPGGIPEHIHHTGRELRKLGHKVTILTTNFGRPNVEDDENIIRVGRAMPRPVNKSIGVIPFGFGRGKRVKEVILDGNFDIVHMHGTSPFLPLLAIRYSKSVNIMTSHASAPEIKLYKYIPFLLQSYIRKADGVIAVSDEALKTLKRFVGEKHTIGRGEKTTRPYSGGFISGKFINAQYAIIPNGIDTERFSPRVEPISKFKDGGPNILFVGRFEPRKGLKYLLQAFTKVHEKLPDARLIVVGKRLREIPNSKFRIPNVYFEGYVATEDIPKYYASCDVFCSPAIGRESFGIVLLEAMSSGKPVVASNIPGYREVVTDGKDGILVEPKNPAAIASALIKVLADNKISRQLGKQGRDTAIKYSWNKVTREIEKFYYEVKRVKEFKS